MLAYNSHHECSVCYRKLLAWCVTKLGGGEGYGSTAVCPSCADKSKLSTVVSVDDDEIVNPSKSINSLVSSTDDAIDDMVEDEIEEDDVRDEATTQSSLDMKVAMLTIITSETYKGTIVCNGIEQTFTFDNAPSPDGRGMTHMFHTEFSLRVPLLYWYCCYGGMCTKFNALPGNCMTECGNFLVCVFETRCPNPRYDPVIYFPATKQCLIVHCREKHWVKKYILAPNAELTVDLKQVQKYCYCDCYFFVLLLLFLIIIIYLYIYIGHLMK